MDVPDTLPAGQYVIYALIDPDDHLTYYVGQTSAPKERLATHRSSKATWIRRLKGQGKRPIMQILEVVIGEEMALAREQVWINLMLQQGMPLVNANSETNKMYLKQAIQPVRQETGNICGCVVRRVWLPDGRTAIIIGELLDYFRIQRSIQLHQIRRDTMMSRYFVYVQITTRGGPQIAAALVEGILPLWLASLQLTYLSTEKLALVDAYLQEAADVLCRQSADRQALVALREEEQAERAQLEKRLLEQEQRVADLKEWFTSLDRQVALLGQRQQEPTLSATHLSDLKAIFRDLEQAIKRTQAQAEAELTTLFKVEAITAIPDAFWPEVLAWYAWSATRS